MFNKPRLLTPGPTPLPERVRLALAQDMIHHRKPGFKKILLETETMLQKLFGTEQPVLPLSCSGTGAMTAAVHGLFLPGETVIVVNGGKFGERWSKIAAVRGLKVVEIDVAWGQAVTPAQVEQALREHPEAKGVFMQGCETSTAAQHPVEAIARLTRTREVLLVADGISAVGVSPCPMDAWGIDCLLTGSQKGLMVPPGMALMALSARAWKRAESIPVSCFYFNLAGERDNLLKGQGLFTSPVNLIVGLHESLSMLFEEGGLDALYRKQWALTCMVRTGALALDLPIIVHDREAHGDSLALVLEYPALRGVFHCFSGSPEMAEALIKRGWYLGIDGPITYKNARRAPEVAEVIPLERIVVETDAPYLTPEPFRGKRNDSRYLPYVIEKMARWKGVTPEELTEITFANGKRLFGLE